MKLQYDESLPNFAFKFDTRRYTMAAELRDRVAHLERDAEVGPAAACLPRHTSLFKPSCLELSCKL